MRLRILTWNIHHAADAPLERIAAQIAAVQPDLAGLQEVDAYRARSGFVHQARRLAALTGLSAWYGSSVDEVLAEPPEGAPRGEHPGLWVTQYGNAALTGLPVLSVENRLLRRGDQSDGTGHQRGCLEVETWAGITLLVTHWGGRVSERRAQCGDVLGLVARLAHAGRGVVLVGDFNAFPETPEMTALREHLQDAGAAAGATAPAAEPRERIDYVLLPKAWRVLRAEALPTDASDHRPLLVEAETEA